MREGFLYLPKAILEIPSEDFALRARLFAGEVERWETARHRPALEPRPELPEWTEPDPF